MKQKIAVADQLFEVTDVFRKRIRTSKQYFVATVYQTKKALDKGEKLWPK